MVEVGGSQILILAIAAFFAGSIDAIVGGGGLIQIPALFSILPQTNSATLLGTNKLAGVWGTGAAALGFSRKVRLHWRVALPAAMAAFGLSLLGAYTVTHVPAPFVRKLLPFILLAVAVYTFRKKQLGAVHAPVRQGQTEIALALVIGAGIGFYDGFFGPGTGSFLVFAFVRCFGFDFLHASATAKIVNVACNLAALLWFGFSGHLLWQLGIVMAICNIGGSLFGMRLALRHGSHFVRKIFLVVVSLLILKTGYDAFLL
jgi:uncharacterized membrane protein YfcA